MYADVPLMMERIAMLEEQVKTLSKVFMFVDLDQFNRAISHLQDRPCDDYTGAVPCKNNLVQDASSSCLIGSSSSADAATQPRRPSPADVALQKAQSIADSVEAPTHHAAPATAASSSCSSPSPALPTDSSKVVGSSPSVNMSLNPPGTPLQSSVGRSSECQRCGGDHATDSCPHFRQSRASHKDAWLKFHPSASAAP